MLRGNVLLVMMVIYHQLHVNSAFVYNVGGRHTNMQESVPLRQRGRIYATSREDDSKCKHKRIMVSSTSFFGPASRGGGCNYTFTSRRFSLIHAATYSNILNTSTIKIMRFTEKMLTKLLMISEKVWTGAR